MVLERSTSAPYCAPAHKLQLPQLEPSYNLVPRHLALHFSDFAALGRRAAP